MKMKPATLCGIAIATALMLTACSGNTSLTTTSETGTEKTTVTTKQIQQETKQETKETTQESLKGADGKPYQIPPEFDNEEKIFHVNNLWMIGPNEFRVESGEATSYWTEHNYNLLIAGSPSDEAEMLFETQFTFAKLEDMPEDPATQFWVNIAADSRFTGDFEKLIVDERELVTINEREMLRVKGKITIKDRNYVHPVEGYFFIINDTPSFLLTIDIFSWAGNPLPKGQERQPEIRIELLEKMIRTVHLTE